MTHLEVKNTDLIPSAVLMDPREPEDLLASIRRHKKKKKGRVLMTSTAASSAADVSGACLKWKDNDGGPLWKPTDGSGIPADVKAKSNTPGRGFGSIYMTKAEAITLISLITRRLSERCHVRPQPRRRYRRCNGEVANNW